MIKLFIGVQGDTIEIEQEEALVRANHRYHLALEQLDTAYADAKQWLEKRIQQEEPTRGGS